MRDVCCCVADLSRIAKLDPKAGESIRDNRGKKGLTREREGTYILENCAH